MDARKYCLVRFFDQNDERIHEIVRSPTEEEEDAMLAYINHITTCDTCQVPVGAPGRPGHICEEGWTHTHLVCFYFFGSSIGAAYSRRDIDERRGIMVQVAIPEPYLAEIMDLLKAPAVDNIYVAVDVPPLARSPDHNRREWYHARRSELE